MTVSTNDLPGAYLLGINDLSQRVPLPEAEQVSQHTPIQWTFAERGPITATYPRNNAAIDLYGAASFDDSSIYATHQTPLIRAIRAQGNPAALKRLVTPDGRTAMIRLSLETIAFRKPIYARTPTGQIVYENVDGESVPVIDSMTNGTRGIFHVGVEMYPDTGLAAEQREFGKGQPIENFRLGSYVPYLGAEPLGRVGAGDGESTAFTTSTLYPILDIPMAWFGAAGNNQGIRIIPTTTRSTVAGDVSLMSRIRSFIYAIQCVERDSKTFRPTAISTVRGEAYHQGTFKDNVTNPRFNTPMSFSQNFVDAYTSTDPAQAKQGPFGDIHVYNDNLNDILNRLTQGYVDATTGFSVDGEAEYDLDAASFGRTADLEFSNTANMHLFNLFTGVDINDIPYYTYSVDDAVMYGGVSLKDGTIIYGAGGDDGLPLDVNGQPDRLAIYGLYDDLVRAELQNFDNETNIDAFMDMGQHPISMFWDSGFSIDTKLEALRLVGLRKDISVTLSTQPLIEWVPPVITPGNPQGDPPTPSVTIPGYWKWLPQNSISEEVSYATLISARASLYPESETYATTVCRVAIVMQSGKLNNSTFTGLMPMTYDLAIKTARYMGALDGRWVNTARFDEYPNNVVDTFKYETVNNTHLTPEVRQALHDMGVISVRYAKRGELFYPNLSTVYTDKTSILSSFITVQACSYMEKVAFWNWTRHTGSQRPPEKLIELLNEDIREQARDRFDNRYTIVPNAQLTPADNQLGYSYTVPIDLFGEVPDYVGTYTINARRASDLGA